MNAEEIETRIEAIRREESRGAGDLALEAVRLLGEMAADPATSDPLFADRFPRVVRVLARIQPSAASPLNAMGTLLMVWLEAGSAGVQAGRAAVAQAEHRWEAKNEADASVIADHTAEIVSGTAITLGYSSTAVRALGECWDRGVLNGVLVAESRPLYEGRRTAAELASRGIPAALITDAEIGVFVSAANAAVVGAETILPSGYLINKTGTNLLALAAGRARIPFYTLAETHRILPGGGRRQRAPLELEERDPAEVLPEPIPGVAVRNVGFDLTTARYITGYITECGLVNRRDILSLARRAPGLIVETGN